jgi:SHS2 domain-containing protein
MTHKKASGYEEIGHTADLSLKVWATTLEDLFINALSGMYSMIDVSVSADDQLELQELYFDEMDHESLLVSFLSECNFKLQNEKEYLDVHEIIVGTKSLMVKFSKFRINKFVKEIKAVTYHNLKIKNSSKGYSVVIVFDV